MGACRAGFRFRGKTYLRARNLAAHLQLEGVPVRRHGPRKESALLAFFNVLGLTNYFNQNRARVQARPAGGPGAPHMQR